jgi:hypothetical protein
MSSRRISTAGRPRGWHLVLPSYLELARVCRLVEPIVIGAENYDRHPICSLRKEPLAGFIALALQQRKLTVYRLVDY